LGLPALLQTAYSPLPGSRLESAAGDLAERFAVVVEPFQS
jgi:hypothetical protein